MTPDWIKTAKVGDKVVCIAEATRIENDRGHPRFQKGKVYTISHLFVDGGEVFLEVEEIGARHIGHWRGFRPVQPRKTDISWAYDILKKASKPVEEHA